MIAEVTGSVAFGIWLYLAAGRGGFWRMPAPNRAIARESPPERSIAAIVPARNEADLVGRALASLFAQDFAGRLIVVLVDDHSTDGTAEAAQRAAQLAGAADRLNVVRARPLPTGWTGKVWAQAEGLRAAQGDQADFYLLTDADIQHPPHELAELVACAETGNYDMVSLMARLWCESPAEQALIPAFVFFFFMLYPPAWVARTDRRTAAAAGGCMLVRRAALERIGGLEVIRGELIDDCALARAVKQGGGIWLAAAQETRSLRPYSGWRGIGAMIARTAFAQLRHSPLLLAATLAGMVVTFLTSPVLLAFAAWPAASATTFLWPAILGGGAWMLMSLLYWPTLRFYRCSPLWAPLLPLIACFYMGATVCSAVLYWRGAGGRWKGRVQDSALRRDS